MKIRHSDSLLLMWRVAELEARQLKATVLEPAHLLLGLCKSIDLDLTTLVSKYSPDRDEVLEELLREVRRLRTVFRSGDLDARCFRRAFRKRLSRGEEEPPKSSPLRRSKTSREAFKNAEQVAEMANCAVYPVHLLYAVLNTADIARDNLLDQLGVEPDRLMHAARHEIALSGTDERPGPGRN